MRIHVFKTIERVDLMDFEHRFAIEDFPIHITIRENVDFLTYDDYMNEDDSFSSKQ